MRALRTVGRYIGSIFFFYLAPHAHRTVFVNKLFVRLSEFSGYHLRSCFGTRFTNVWEIIFYDVFPNPNEPTEIQ